MFKDPQGFIGILRVHWESVRATARPATEQSPPAHAVSHTAVPFRRSWVASKTVLLHGIVCVWVWNLVSHRCDWACWETGRGECFTGVAGSATRGYGMSAHELYNSKRHQMGTACSRFLKGKSRYRICLKSFWTENVCRGRKYVGG
jgi:hypothetical protein